MSGQHLSLPVRRHRRIVSQSQTSQATPVAGDSLHTLITPLHIADCYQINQVTMEDTVTQIYDLHQKLCYHNSKLWALASMLVWQGVDWGDLRGGAVGRGTSIFYM